MRYVFTAAIVLFLLSALAISSRCSPGGIPLRLTRWFLGLDEAEEFAIPLWPADGARSP